MILQQWLVRVRSAQPGLAFIAEIHTPDMLIRKLLDGVLDLAFMLEPPQLEVLQTRDIGKLSLRLVSSVANTDLESALGDGYLMVDWGLTHALQHRRLFADAPEPQSRFASGNLTLHYLLEIGGSAYLPESMLLPYVETGRLHRVKDAPEIDHRIHAVYLGRSGRLELIDEVLSHF